MDDETTAYRYTDPTSPRLTAPRGPLAVWGATDNADERLLWWSQLDDRYLVEVEVHTEGSALAAELAVFDHSDGDRELLREPVALAAETRFGPDIADVAAWQARVIALVDGPRDPRDSQ